MSDENSRINLLERRVDDVSTSINSKLDTISTTLVTLVRIEERQGNQNIILSDIKVAVTEQESRLRKIEVSLPSDLSKRLSVIEQDIEPLKESRKWMILGILAGLGMIGASMMHTIIK